jgi:putative glycosyltransferase (TIGR04372 family)
MNLKKIFKKLLVSDQMVSAICFLINSFPFFRFGFLRGERFGHFLGDFDTCLQDVEKDFQTRKRHILLLSIQNGICNNYILELYTRVKLKKTVILIFSGNTVNNLFIRLKNHPKIAKLFFNVEFKSENCFKRLKEDPFLKPYKYEIIQSEKKLKDKLKIKNNNPFVYLHARDPAFLSGDTWKYHSYRDFSASVFLPLIKKHKTTLNFIRGGSVAVERMPFDLQNCIDLPFLPKDDMLSVLAHSLSIFYFGSDSGAWLGSFCFRKPIAMINFSGTAFGYARKLNALKLGFIPKKIKCKNTDRYLSLKELYELKVGHLWRTEDYDSSGLETISNSDDEVSEFFDESISLVKNNLFKTDFSDEQKEFWKIVTFYEPDSFGDQLMLDNCHIGEQFLRRNAYLIA